MALFTDVITTCAGPSTSIFYVRFLDVDVLP